MPTTCSRLLGWVALLAGAADAGGGGVFVGRAGRQPRMPAQRAVIHFRAGRQITILQVDYDGPDRDFAWVVPVPQGGRVEPVEAERNPFHELARFTDPEARSGGARPPGMPDASKAATPPPPGAALGRIELLASAEALDAWLRRAGLRLPAERLAAIRRRAGRKCGFAVARPDRGRLAAAGGRGRSGPLGALRLTFSAKTAEYPLRLSSLNPGPTEVLLYVLSEAPLAAAADARLPAGFDVAANVPSLSRPDPRRLRRIVDPTFGTYARPAWPQLHLTYLATGQDYGRRFHLCRYRGVFRGDDRPDLAFRPFRPVPYWRAALRKAAPGSAAALHALYVLSHHEAKQRAAFAGAAARVGAAGDAAALRRLARSPNVSDRLALAGREDLPKEIVLTLAGDQDAAVRRRAAAHQSLPFERKLAIVLADGTALMQAALAADKRTPPAALKQLARRRASAVRRGVAANTNAPADVLRPLGRDPHAHVRAAVARNPSAPADLLAELTKDEHLSVCLAVAANEAAGRELLRTLAARIPPVKGPDGRRLNRLGRIRAERTRRPEALRRLAGDGDEQVRLAVARNPRTPADVLAALAKDASPAVKLAVLGRLADDHAVLHALLSELAAAGRSRAARLAAAEHPRCRPPLLAKLSADADARVRAAVAGNRRAPGRLLERLSADKAFAVRAAAARNPAAPPALLARLAGEAKARAAVASNPSAPPALLGSLARCSDWQVRWAVTANPSTPPEVLHLLLRDVEVRVAYQAWKRLH